MANLTQLKMLEDLNAVLLVDKPAGIAFSTVVKTVKRKFNLVKVGHGGSLDAAASGLLVLLINDANKYVGDIMGADRAYTGTMRLGVKTNTGDIHGEPLRGFVPCASCLVPREGTSSDRQPSLQSLMDEARSTRHEFLGDVFLTEPRYCSVRREGSAEYEIADTGEHKPLLVHVWDFDVCSTENESASVAADTANGKPHTVDSPQPTANCKPHTANLTFSLSATKGIIVRALVSDFGDALGCGAVLDTCRRTRVGKFKVEDAVKFGKLLEMEIGDFASCTIALDKALR